MGDGSSERVVTWEESMDRRASKVNNKLAHELDGETMVIGPWDRDGLIPLGTNPPMLRFDESWARLAAEPGIESPS